MPCEKCAFFIVTQNTAHLNTGNLSLCKKCNLKAVILVTVMLQMLLVSVIRQHVLWVVLSDPLGFLNVETARLSLHLLPLPASRNRRREA